MVVRLEWLEIKKFRNVKPCKLTFNEGHNVLLGLNATGKTTLLELVCMALWGSFASLRDEEFSFAGSIQLGGTRLEMSVQTRAALSPIAPLTQLTGEAQDLDVEWSLTVVPEKGKAWKTKWPGGTFKSPVPSMPLDGSAPFGSSLGWYILPLVIGAPSLDPERTELVRNGCVRFDESIGFFEGLFAGSDSPSTPRVRLIAGAPLVAQMVPAEEVGTWLEQHMAVSEGPPKAPGPLSLDAIAETVRTGLQVDAVTMTMVFQEREGGTRGYRGIDMLITDRGREYTQAKLSYGQKRLVGFLYYSACASVIVADELVNGMHHSWIDACMKEIGDRQSFLTSQNALLLDHLELKSPEEAQKMFIVCRKEEGQLSWENITMEQAKDIFEAREVGIQQLSEILLARGLW